MAGSDKYGRDHTAGELAYLIAHITLSSVKLHLSKGRLTALMLCEIRLSFNCLMYEGHVERKALVKASHVSSVTLKASHVSSATLKASHVSSATLKASHVSSVTLKASHVSSVTLKQNLFTEVQFAMG